MEKKFILTILLLFSVSLVFGCTQANIQENTSTTENNPSQNTQNAGQRDYAQQSQTQSQDEEKQPLPNPIQIIDQNSAPSETISILIQNYSFKEQDIIIPVGTTVTWTNMDSVQHTATANNNEFQSKLLAKGETYSFTFNTKGEYNYYCAPHPNMKGTIIVQ